MNYNTNNSDKARKILIILLLVITAAGIGYMIGTAANAEDQQATCWIMCRPGSQVNVRKRADKKSETVGYLESCDDFKTDGQTKDGWVHVLNIGEYGDGWVYVGYVVTEQPKAVYQNYVCVAKKQAACRKWIGGPQTDKKWIRNGCDVSVFFIADGWACTSRGFIQAEWLEANPL